MSHRAELLDQALKYGHHPAMNEAARRARCRIEDPPPLDGLMRYVMLGSTYASLLACMFFARFIMESPKVVVLLPLERVSHEDLTGAWESQQDRTISIAADGAVRLGEHVIGKPEDSKLFLLYLAVLQRRVRDKNAPPLVIRVSPQATHGRMMAVLNALAAARERRYVVTFGGSPVTDLLWREG